MKKNMVSRQADQHLSICKGIVTDYNGQKLDFWIGSGR